MVRSKRDLTLSHLESYDLTPNAEVLPCSYFVGQKARRDDLLIFPVYIKL